MEGIKVSSVKQMDLSFSTLLVSILFLPFLLHALGILELLPLARYNALRFSMMASMIALLFACLCNVRVNLKLFALLTSISVLLLSSLFFNGPKVLPLEAWFLVGLLLLSGLFMVGIHQDREQAWQVFLAIVLVAAFFYTAHTLAFFLLECTLNRVCLSHETGFIGFENRRLYNDIQAVIIPVLFYFFIRVKHRGLLVLLLLMLSIQLVHLLITYGRASMLGAGLAVAFLLYSSPKSLQVWQRILMLLLLAVTMFITLYSFDQQGSILEVGVRTSTSGRYELWLSAWQEGWSSPWLGNGPGSFAFYGHHVAGPHNVFLELFNSYGLIVLVLAIYLAVKSFYLSFQENNPLQTAVLIGLSSVWLFTSTTQPFAQLLTFFMLCYVFSKNYVADTRMPLLPYILLLVWSGILLYAVLSYQAPTEMIKRPRFWLSTEVAGIHSARDFIPSEELDLAYNKNYA